MAHYIENECAIIYRNRDRFGGLSNMYPIALSWEGALWSSSEALYQALRYPNDPWAQARIRLSSSPMNAKKMAYEFIAETRPDWQRVKVTMMENVLRLKVTQNWVFMRTLLDESGDMPIVEKSRRDDFWGAKPDGHGSVEGQNVLGLLWMLIREELRRDEFEAEAFIPLTS